MSFRIPRSGLDDEPKGPSSPHLLHVRPLGPKSRSPFTTASFQPRTAVLIERGHRAFVGLAQVGDQYHLTRREREAMALLLHGLTSRQKKKLTFAEIQQLSADFNVDGGDGGGDSPRFQINIDTDNDGDFDGNIFVHFCPSPFFTNCALGWQNTGNLIGNNDTGRYDSGLTPPR